MGYLGYQNIKKLTKLSKGIDLSKQVINKESYALYAIKKAKRAPYKSYIRPRQGPLDLIYSNIYGPIIPRGRYNDKYIVIFLDNWNKRSKVEIIN